MYVCVCVVLGDQSLKDEHAQLEFQMHSLQVSMSSGKVLPFNKSKYRHCSFTVWSGQATIAKYIAVAAQ